MPIITHARISTPYVNIDGVKEGQKDMGTKIVRSHFLPRTTKGTVMVVYFLICYLMVEWPILRFANKIHPRIAGTTFLYGWLLIWYILFCIGAIITAKYVWKVKKDEDTW